MGNAALYLIPSLLDENGQQSIPPSIKNAIEKCQVFFVENERTTRRYLKKIWKDIVIDNYEWHIISKETITKELFRKKIKEGKSIGIISEAGCPGVADPGQELVAIAQEMNITIKPLVGPNSILLALMASGMNGQQFQFLGYLPIQELDIIRSLKEMEIESIKKKCSQIFIETPYRNMQMFETILKTAKPTTRLCIAVELTGEKEWIKTMSITDWKKLQPSLHKRPAIFILQATN